MPTPGIIGTRAKVPPERQPLQIALDWEKYFQEFLRHHGGNPILLMDEALEAPARWLFQDGWTYNANDYAGPEWPPPKDPDALNALIRHYWLSRLEIVARELRWIHERIEKLEMLQEVRSVPLQAKYSILSSMRNEDGRESFRMTTERGPVDFELLNARKKELEWDVQNCENHLEEQEGVSNV